MYLIILCLITRNNNTYGSERFLRYWSFYVLFKLDKPSGQPLSPEFQFGTFFAKLHIIFYYMQTTFKPFDPTVTENMSRRNMHSFRRARDRSFERMTLTFLNPGAKLHLFIIFKYFTTIHQVVTKTLGLTETQHSI